VRESSGAFSHVHGRDLGNGSFWYEGAQGVDVPQVSFGDPSVSGKVAIRIGATTGPRSIKKNAGGGRPEITNPEAAPCSRVCSLRQSVSLHQSVLVPGLGGVLSIDSASSGAFSDDDVPLLEPYLAFLEQT
jgi:hypothetical protein